MTTTTIYHTPYRSEVYLDAMANLSLFGYDELDILHNILLGIHERNPLNYRTMWVTTASYDFPFQPEDITLQNWEECLYFYYDILQYHITQIVQPFHITPRKIVVANIDYSEMVIDYVF